MTITTTTATTTTPTTTTTIVQEEWEAWAGHALVLPWIEDIVAARLGLGLKRGGEQGQGQGQAGGGGVGSGSDARAQTRLRALEAPESQPGVGVESGCKVGPFHKAQVTNWLPSERTARAWAAFSVCTAQGGWSI